MDRAAILEAATKLVTADREADHGSPATTMSLVANLWSAYTGTELTASDACNMMILLKVARAHANPANHDNQIDAAGYSALSAELSDSV